MRTAPLTGLFSSLAILLTACGGGGGGSGGGKPTPQINTVEDSLDALGVPRKITPRRDENGKAIPESFAPLGSTWNYTKVAELFVAGVEMTDTRVAANAETLYEDYPAGDKAPWPGRVKPAILRGKTKAETPWLMESGVDTTRYSTARSFTAADVDGNSREEIVGAFVDSGMLKLRVTADSGKGYGDRFYDLQPVKDVRNVEVDAGDFDGDGLEEVVVAVSTDTKTELLFLDDAVKDFAVQTSLTKTLLPVLKNSVMSVNMATGTIDYDGARELAVVVNEWQSKTRSATRFYLFDDSASKHAPLRSGPIAGKTKAGKDYTMVVGDVGIGDVDADSIGEIVLGGLVRLPNRQACRQAEYLLVAIDDKEHGLAQFPAHYQERRYACNTLHPHAVAYAHLNLVDIDGDHRPEIQINDLIFEDFEEALIAKERWLLVWRTDPDLIAAEWGSRGTGLNAHLYERSITAVAAGDFIKDKVVDNKRAEIAFYKHDRRDKDNSDIVIVGVGLAELSQKKNWNPRTDPPMSLAKKMSIQTRTGNVLRSNNPVLVAANTDEDSIAVRIVPSQSRLVFTQPVVIAALATPPFGSGINQDIDSCVTEFGNSTATGSERSKSLSVSSSVTVGFKAGSEVVGVEVEVTETMSRVATRSTSKGYELTKTIVRTTSPGEDAVIFSSLPMDVYEYTIVNYPDEPQLKGKTILVNLPRSPGIFMLERGFYNRNVVPGSLLIDEKVFQHKPGDYRSYMGIAEMRNRVGSSELFNGPVDVTQTGNAYAGIEIAKTKSKGKELETSFETSVQVTGGFAIGGFSVGHGESNGLTYTTGSSTFFGGTVGHVPTPFFADNLYKWGVFAYKHRDGASRQEFWVVNYWVN